MMLALVLLAMLAGSGLTFHAIARASSPKARSYGTALAAVAFTVVSVILLAPFYRHDSSRIVDVHIAAGAVQRAHFCRGSVALALGHFDVAIPVALSAGIHAALDRRWRDHDRHLRQRISRQLTRFQGSARLAGVARLASRPGRSATETWSVRGGHLPVTGAHERTPKSRPGRSRVTWSPPHVAE